MDLDCTKPKQLLALKTATFRQLYPNFHFKKHALCINYDLCKSPVTGQFKEASMNIQITVTTHIQRCPALTMGGS